VIHALLVFLHVLATASWFGATLWLATDVRRTLALGRPHPDALAARVGPPLGLDALAGVATLATGLLLMWEGAMGHPPPGISAGIVLALVRLGVLAAMRGATRRIIARLRAGEAVAPGDPAARRLAMLSGIAHTAWILALAGMVFPI
jgi:hypothetical protein